MSIVARFFRQPRRPSAVNHAAFACLCLASLALVFLFVPQWLIVDLPMADRTARIWLAVAWVFAALCAFGYTAVRVSTRGRDVAEPPE